MRIQLTIDGGITYFPGLSQPLALESDELPGAEVAELERLAGAARVFEQPAVTDPAPGSADHRTYTITVEDAGREHTFRVSDPIGNPDVAALIRAVQAAARRRPGGPPPSP